MKKTYLEKLEQQREDARIKLAKIQREIEVLDQILHEVHKDNNTIYSPQILPKTKRSTDYSYYANKITKTLLQYEEGLKTKELFDIIADITNLPPKDSTFRSYLSRLKNKGVIYQENKAWKHKHRKQRKHLTD